MYTFKTTALIKNCLLKGITVLALGSFISSVNAQIRPSTGEERQKGVAVRKELEQK